MKNIVLKRNREKLAAKIEDNSLIILFSGRAPYKSGDEKYDFVPNKNYYYMTGIHEENTILAIYKVNGQVSEYLFIEEIDMEEARWTGMTITREEAQETSGIKNIEYTKLFEKWLGTFMNYYRIDNIYFDLERQEFNINFTESQKLAHMIRDRYPHINIRNIFNDISYLRTVKDEEEIELIRKAISITDEGIKSMMKNSKPGMMEYELEAHFNYELNRRGINKYAFKSIVASGKNATILHYTDNNNEVGENDLVLIDLGAQYKMYNADISRTFPAGGKFTERQKDIYSIVLEANKKVMESTRPGITMRDLQNISKKVLAEGCMRIGLIEKEEELIKYYFHGVSHSLGLDDHDVDPGGLILKPGMVITDEPGLYIEEEGIGIRIEDDILVTEEGYENLSKDIIKEIEDIEKFMSDNRER